MIAALVLGGQRLLTGNQRTIVLSSALKADLLRHYQDQLSRPPTRAEADAFMTAWKTDEALYREALREGTDRDDPTVRNVLISKSRSRLTLQTPVREPTAADLQAYLTQHRDQFVAPLIYEHVYVTFSKADAGAAQERTKYEGEFLAGATPASLGLRSTAAKVDRARIEQAFGPEVAARIVALPVGQWHELETPEQLLLVEVLGVEGGLPPPDVLHSRLVAGWTDAQEQAAAARSTRAITDRYHFEEPSR
ncbi:MAG: peptidylprolyl isomerase [Polyangiaceae bacterium]